MALTLDTNINSLNAQRNLNTSQASLSTALQRLSSGLRINSAADDAAGLAISSQFTTQINGTNQAVSNANNAISEAQTAGGALSTLTDSLQSIRTLAVEAANGSNSPTDRAALDQQVQAQISEITRIASQTSFNGLNVLDGSSGVTTYQVGANVGNTISVNLAQGVRADQIGQYASSTNTVTGTALATGDLSLQVGNGPVVGIAASVAGTGNNGQAAGSAYALAQSINSAGITGLTATATTSTAAAAFTPLTGATGTGGTYALSINGVSIFGSTGLALAAGATLSQSQVTTAINAVSSQTGVIASTAPGSSGNLVLTAADGSNITVAQTATNVGTGAGMAAAVVTTTHGQLTVSAASAITVGGATAGSAGLTGGTIAASSGTLSTQNVLTVGGANSTINAVDSALATVSAFQSQLGAIQNRFTSTVANLQSTAQNLTASRSTIQDTNFASETANLTQSQVLQQAGISVLAQANSEPQLILKLLP
jgi:flagellin